MKYYKKYKWEIILAFFVLIFLGAGIFYIIPTILSIKQSSEKIASVSLKNEGLVKKIQALDSFSKSDLEEKYQLANNALLSTKNPYKVFNSFDSILGQVDAKDLIMGEIKFSPGEVKNNVGINPNDNLSFATTLAGNYDVVTDFINKLESNYPLMDVKSIDGKITDKSQSDFKMTFSLFVYPEITFIPSLETPISGFSQKENDLFNQLISTVSGALNDNNLKPVTSGREDPFR